MVCREQAHLTYQKRAIMSSKKQNAVQSIRMYSTTWCGDCRRSKRFLQEHQIDFEEIDIEKNPEAAAVVISLNRGKRSVPTIVFPDGSVLVEPSNTTLANKLGIKS
jgi:glutaredoxin-like protein